MMFERHSLKVDGYSAIAPENIANECFFQNYGIENNKTYKDRVTEATKRVTKNMHSYTSKENRVGMANIT